VSELVPDALVDAACRQTGLTDFGGDSFREGLAHLCESLNREAELSTAGAAMAQHSIAKLLANRLQIQDWYRRQPEIDAEAIPAPIFVLGLPRTGTTALSNLLARDPDTRSLRTWESSSPCPPPESATEHTDPRIAKTEAGMALMDQVLPEMRMLYDTTATGPSECQDLLGMDFKAQHVSGQFWVPSFAAWQRDCDMRSAYQMHRKTLKLLQWRCPPNRWHLKTPVHMLSLDALVAIYPDARFVMTHRDPARVLGSVCSLISKLRTLTSAQRNPAATGEEQLALWTEALARAIRFREKVGDARFADLHFRAQLGDPIAAVEQAYRKLGIPLTQAARARMQTWAREHRRGRLGTHEYRLSDYGLSPELVRERFAFYTSRFDVELEG
jgi:hypothetical protein